MTSPQSVTSRYSNNLLRDGKNERYEIVNVVRGIASVSNIPVGTYYNVTLAIPSENFKELIGLAATPIEALNRALQQDGVTFR